MKLNNILIYIMCVALAAQLISCSNSTKTYAELVEDENSYIDRFMGMEGINTINIDEDDISDWTRKVLVDSVHPSKLIQLNQWYSITDGDCKRLSFMIKSWGNDKDYQKNFFKNKIKSGSFALVRYDSLYQLTDTVNIHNNLPVDNLDPYDYELIMNWTTSYYLSQYYSSYYGTGSQYECTSGGVGFPVRFLWYGGRVSLIVPFSLVSLSMQNYYYTLYYGDVEYKYPQYIPE